MCYNHLLPDLIFKKNNLDNLEHEMKTEGTPFANDGPAVNRTGTAIKGNYRTRTGHGEIFPAGDDS